MNVTTIVTSPANIRRSRREVLHFPVRSAANSAIPLAPTAPAAISPNQTSIPNCSMFADGRKTNQSDENPNTAKNASSAAKYEVVQSTSPPRYRRKPGWKQRHAPVITMPATIAMKKRGPTPHVRPMIAISGDPKDTKVRQISPAISPARKNVIWCRFTLGPPESVFPFCSDQAYFQTLFLMILESS